MSNEGPPDWNERYAQHNVPWDTGKPSSELGRLLGEYDIPPGRALELGCGTGTNAIFLAQQGFQVTAFDLSPRAIDEAEAKATVAGVELTLMTADLLDPPDFGEPFPFVFDRGVYHTVRRTGLDAFLETLSRVTTPGGMYLTLTGNANEFRPGEEGPPRVTAEEICRELDPLMQLVQLREFRFSETPQTSDLPRALAWSALFRRKP